MTRLSKLYCIMHLVKLTYCLNVSLIRTIERALKSNSLLATGLVMRIIPQIMVEFKQGQSLLLMLQYNIAIVILIWTNKKINLEFRETVFQVTCIKFTE